MCIGLLFKTSNLCSQPSFIILFWLLSFRQIFSITFWIGNRQLNRQLVGNCPSNQRKTSIGHLTFSKVSMLCSQPFFYTYVEASFVQTNECSISQSESATESATGNWIAIWIGNGNWIGIWIGNRQLYRQPATKPATGNPLLTLRTYIYWFILLLLKHEQNLCMFSNLRRLGKTQFAVFSSSMLPFDMPF